MRFPTPRGDLAARHGRLAGPITSPSTCCRSAAARSGFRFRASRRAPGVSAAERQRRGRRAPSRRRVRPACRAALKTYRKFEQLCRQPADRCLLRSGLLSDQPDTVMKAYGGLVTVESIQDADREGLPHLLGHLVRRPPRNLR